MPKSTTNTDTYNAFVLPPLEKLEPQLFELASEACGHAAMQRCEPDMMFGDFADAISFSRAAQTLEGNLLRDGVALVLNAAGLTVLKEIDLPVTDSALSIARDNDQELLKELRQDLRAFAESSYRADLVIANEADHAACVLEVKRATTSYSPGRLKSHHQRMIAAAMMVPNLLWGDHRIAVKHVDVLILDAVGTDCRPGSPAVRLSGIEHKLGIEGLTVAIDRLRQVYADEVMAELHRRIGAINVDASDSAVEAGIEPIANPTEPEADDPTSEAETATAPESMADWTFSLGMGADFKGVA